MGKERRKKRSSIVYFLSNFKRKHRVSVRDQQTDEEVSYIYLSPVRILVTLFGVVLILSGIAVMLVVYTPVLDNLPGYPGKKTRNILMESVVRLDSLDNELRKIIAYSENVAVVMDGKTPSINTIGESSEVAGGDKTIIGPSSADSLLRTQLEAEEGRFALLREKEDMPIVRSRGSLREFLVPVQGDIISFFSPSADMNGVTIKINESQPIIAVDDGMVVMSLWTPENNYVMQIYHKGNYLTIYKNASQLLKSVGEYVNKGEVIGYVDSDLTSNAQEYKDFVFEMWSDGQPIDPQRYILF